MLLIILTQSLLVKSSCMDRQQEASWINILSNGPTNVLLCVVLGLNSASASRSPATRKTMLRGPWVSESHSSNRCSWAFVRVRMTFIFYV
ncbi:hypothetical protein CPB83DRAFT_854408 [Crepidotus variabilis]|uniref:Secreted protein n=1 Tax=Crepidotus variabilis TaxID=179855 RepID=A0A9P6JQ45_9AGAR|nr:hypothetical protein CPB83DRAFT_854408 [Crepidotus variabilis]